VTTPFEKSTRDWLRREAESLDGQTRSQLNRARQQALAELKPRSRWARTPFLPLTAAAGAAVVAALLLLPGGTIHSLSPAPTPVVVIDEGDLGGAGGQGMFDEDPTLFALAAVGEAAL
jgi:hypothetical protein